MFLGPADFDILTLMNPRGEKPGIETQIRMQDEDLAKTLIFSNLMSHGCFLEKRHPPTFNWWILVNYSDLFSVHFTISGTLCYGAAIYF